MWSLDYCKIAYFQYDFSKESSKIKSSHMVHTKKCLFFNVLHTNECKKWLVFIVFGHTGFYQRIYSKAFDFSNPKALDKESKTGFNATFI